LNDLGPEILVKEKALEIHGSLERMRETRKLEYEESQRLHWKSDPRQLLPTAPEAPEEKYEYWISVEKRYKEDVIHILGYVERQSIADVQACQPRSTISFGSGDMPSLRLEWPPITSTNMY